MNYGSSLLYNFIKYPSITSFLGMLALVPTFCMLSIFFVNINIYIMYFFIIQFVTFFLLIVYFSLKIKKDNSFLKSFLVISICIYGFGIGFLLTILNYKKLKEYYIQG